ncbi:hypothetical protein A3C23_02585 [Candidatus Roizmanbacteria bacterium RIFCSPHIGHO2_02_FULL_37_13b]|uniref:O-antigen ligase-related domain-containing protein n=1 Tax=Candidatus Roizmanbacteria bacterium RIFCSPLOWO2_02_FULL_36_11 TaxID=1802071 RepID=A0A1F7JG23_9BACT|nr:MAG: hypothetical protein A3C23_02585 [Candidatus Roizmanbacteria bacterium RIFCSPHIGHO2_02_FULL_37_13b]OGK54560.1 MAG: hypothetical protein A3H78_01595 [Candidatus Roizmanbacteria bacterium RIFCSPLOWO2_02_FULL_36_11]
MNWLIYLLFIALSFGQLARISFLNQVININLHDVIIFSFILFAFLRYRQRLYLFIIKEKLILLLIAIFSISLIISFWNFSLLQNSVGLLYLSRLVMYLLFFISLSYWRRHEKQSEHILKQGFYIFTSLIIFFGLIQYFVYSNLRNLYYLGWDPHQSRVFATFFDTTISGLIFSMVILILISLAIKTPKSLKKKLLIFGFVGVFALMMLTYSRITYLSSIIACLYYFRNKLKTSYLIISMIIFFGLIWLLPRPFGEGVKLERLFTISSRVEDIRSGLQVFSKSPIIGVGYNRIGYVKNQEKSIIPSHATFGFASSYIIILASTGMAGFLIFLKWLLDLFKRGDNVSQTLMILILVASLFDNVFLNSFILILFFLLYQSRVNLSRRLL